MVARTLKNTFFLITLLGFPVFGGTHTQGPVESGARNPEYGTKGEFVRKNPDYSVPPKCIPLKFSHFDAEFSTEGVDLDEAVSKLDDKNQLITVSIDGAHKYGFSHAYSMERSDGDRLQSFFKRFLAVHQSQIKKVQYLSAKLAKDVAGQSSRSKTCNAKKPCLQNLSPFEILELDEDGKSALDELMSEMSQTFEREYGSANGADNLRRHFNHMAKETIAGNFSYSAVGDVLEILSPFGLDSANKSINDSFPPSEYYVNGGWEYKRDNGQTMGELDIIVARKSDCSVVALGESKLTTTKYMRKRFSKARSQLKRFVGRLKELRERAVSVE
jgi:hypothetical protein